MTASLRRRHAPVLIGIALAALASSQAQAIGCEELRASIAEKMKRGGLARTQIVVLDAAERSAGRVVGSCETGSKKLVLLSPAGEDEARLAVHQAAAPAPRKTARRSEARDDDVLVECFDGKQYTDGPCKR